jgi:hypothetical protein
MNPTIQQVVPHPVDQTAQDLLGSRDTPAPEDLLEQGPPPIEVTREA